MKKIRDESELLGQLSALPSEMAPRRDVWPQIAVRIGQTTPAAEAGEQRRRYWPLAAAASVLLVLAGGVLMRNQWEAPGLAVHDADSTAVLGRPPGKAYSSGSLTSGELEYQAALREFLALNDLPGAGEEPKPEWMERGWETLREVELELTAALRDEPANEFLKTRLVALRARQIELLQQIAAVDSASWRNNI